MVCPSNPPNTKHSLPSTSSTQPVFSSVLPTPNLHNTTTQIVANTLATHRNTDEKPQHPLLTPLHPAAHPRPQHQNTETDTAIFIDSNGKFLQVGDQKINKLWFPRTADTLILFDPSFGTPSHILIHTGTNDLRAQQEKVGWQSSRKGHRDQPQLKDHHLSPPTPQRFPTRVNADISKGCVCHVHLVYLSTITTNDLYDHVHTIKDMVKVFAKTINTAWGRHTTSTPPKRRHPSNHQKSHNHPHARNSLALHRETLPIQRHYWGPQHHSTRQKHPPTAISQPPPI